MSKRRVCGNRKKRERAQHWKFFCFQQRPKKGAAAAAAAAAKTQGARWSIHTCAGANAAKGREREVMGG